MQTEDNTHSRFRRPGPWSVVPNFTLTDRRLRPCSRQARHLYMAGWVHANQNRTDGEITSEDLATLAGSLRLTYQEIQAAAAELVQAELWRPGLWIVDFLKWCLDANEIEKRKADTLARVHAHRRDAKKGSPDLSKETEETEETDINRRQQVRTDVRNALHDQEETEEQKTVRLAIAQLAKDKALEFNGQGRGLESPLPTESVA